MGDRISLITLEGEKREKQEARESIAVTYDFGARLAERVSKGTALEIEKLQRLDRLIKWGENLTYEQAFSGMCHVLSATNVHFFNLCWGEFDRDARILREKALAAGVAFIQLMAAKEALRSLKPEEIAGMVSAALMDTVFRFSIPRVVETCGMGGDIGFRVDGTIQKTINVSTLSAIVLSAVGLPVIKHGSYSNTSAVGSTEAIERFGAHTSMDSAKEVERIWSACGFCYFDAHWCKTIHDLSHLLMVETINHIIGPMSLSVNPQTEVNKVMGVNEKVHPSVVARAYTILHQRKVQRVGGVIVVGGLDDRGYMINPSDVDAFRAHCIIDEVSPYATVCSVAYQGSFLGDFILYPEDFGVSIDPETIKVSNTADAIQQANITALRGENDALVDYLAMNAALGLFAERFVAGGDAVIDNQLNRAHLQTCYQECREAITSGRAWEKLVLYVSASGGTLSLL